MTDTRFAVLAAIAAVAAQDADAADTPARVAAALCAALSADAVSVELADPDLARRRWQSPLEFDATQPPAESFALRAGTAVVGSLQVYRSAPLEPSEQTLVRSVADLIQVCVVLVHQLINRRFLLQIHHRCQQFVPD